MKHKHAEFIHLMANGVRIEVYIKLRNTWRLADWDDFNATGLEFRISTNQLPDTDGWVPWHGGENPAPGKIVCIKCRVGGVPVNFASSNLDWRHKGSDGDIVAYRIAKQVKKWRWMCIKDNSAGTVLPEFSPYFSTEEEAKEWSRGLYKVGPRQDWTEVECE